MDFGRLALTHTKHIYLNTIIPFMITKLPLRVLGTL